MVHSTCHHYVFFFLRARCCEIERSTYIKPRFLSGQHLQWKEFVYGKYIKNYWKLLKKCHCSEHVNHHLVYYIIYPEIPNILLNVRDCFCCCFIHHWNTILTLTDLKPHRHIIGIQPEMKKTSEKMPSPELFFLFFRALRYQAGTCLDS